MEKNQTCDKLRFMQKDFCIKNNNTNLCKELENTIQKENCPKCEVLKHNNSNIKNYPQIGCGIGMFVVKD
jgi:hypothetical protein